MDLNKISELEAAILDDYKIAAKSLMPLHHEYVVIIHNCDDGNILYGFTKRCQWRYIILKQKIIIINYDADKNFKEKITKFIDEVFATNGYEYELTYCDNL